LFNRSTKDETLFPPRCCRQAIPFDRVENKLSPDYVRRFKVAEVGFGTKNRVYCSNRECGIFVLPNNVLGDIGHCQGCGSDACAICKQAGHSGDCPDDPDLQATLKLASEKGWRRCNNCHRMVEISYGCNHMM
jgi:hypothetical protein